MSVTETTDEERIENRMDDLIELARGIARSGNHTLLIGPPGTGKAMIARRVAESRVPRPEHQAAISDIYRCSGLDAPRLTQVPFRAPHHTVSGFGLRGSKPSPAGAPKYGELSLAHGGVLFLDEAPEFARANFALVRHAIEHGYVEHASGGSPFGINQAPNVVRYPAEFQLVMATSPCPCGRGVGNSIGPCMCSSESVRRYKERIKGLEDLCQVIDLRAV